MQKVLPACNLQMDARAESSLQRTTRNVDMPRLGLQACRPKAHRLISLSRNLVADTIAYLLLLASTAAVWSQLGVWLSGSKSLVRPTPEGWLPLTSRTRMCGAWPFLTQRKNRIVDAGVLDVAQGSLMREQISVWFKMSWPELDWLYLRCAREVQGAC